MMNRPSLRLRKAADYKPTAEIKINPPALAQEIIDLLVSADRLPDGAWTVTDDLEAAIKEDSLHSAQDIADLIAGSLSDCPIEDEKRVVDIIQSNLSQKKDDAKMAAAQLIADTVNGGAGDGGKGPVGPKDKAKTAPRKDPPAAADSEADPTAGAEATAGKRSRTSFNKGPSTPVTRRQMDSQPDLSEAMGNRHIDPANYPDESNRLAGVLEDLKADNAFNAEGVLLKWPDYLTREDVQALVRMGALTSSHGGPATYADTRYVLARSVRAHGLRKAETLWAGLLSALGGHDNEFNQAVDAAARHLSQDDANHARLLYTDLIKALHDLALEEAERSKSVRARGLRKADAVSSIASELDEVLKSYSGAIESSGLFDLASHIEMAMNENPNRTGIKGALSLSSKALDSANYAVGYLKSAQKIMAGSPNKAAATPLQKVALPLTTDPKSWTLAQLGDVRRALSLEIGKVITLSVTDVVPGVYHRGKRIGSLVGGQALIKVNMAMMSKTKTMAGEAYYTTTGGTQPEEMTQAEALALIEKLGDRVANDSYDGDGQWEGYAAWEVYDEGKSADDYPDGDPYADCIYIRND